MDLKLKHVGLNQSVILIIYLFGKLNLFINLYIEFKNLIYFHF